MATCTRAYVDPDLVTRTSLVDAYTAYVQVTEVGCELLWRTTINNK